MLLGDKANCFEPIKAYKLKSFQLLELGFETIRQISLSFN